MLQAIFLPNRTWPVQFLSNNSKGQEWCFSRATSSPLICVKHPKVFPGGWWDVKIQEIANVDTFFSMMSNFRLWTIPPPPPTPSSPQDVVFFSTSASSDSIDCGLLVDFVVWKKSLVILLTCLRWTLDIFKCLGARNWLEYIWNWKYLKLLLHSTFDFSHARNLMHPKNLLFESFIA